MVYQKARVYGPFAKGKTVSVTQNSPGNQRESSNTTKIDSSKMHPWCAAVKLDVCLYDD